MQNQIDRTVGQARNVGDTARQLFIDIGEYSGALGFGVKVIVPPDEVWVVTGDGRHAIIATDATSVYGSYRQGEGDATTPSLKSSSRFYRNPHTQIVPLRKRAFTVDVAVDAYGTGIMVRDSENVEYTVEAAVQAQLLSTYEGIILASEKVGADPGPSLVEVVKGVTEAQLRAAAAKMTLSDVMENYDSLSDAVHDEVNRTLLGLGYELIFIKIGELGGPAVKKLVGQANAEIQANSTIKTNASQLKEKDDNEKKKRREAELNAETARQTAVQENESKRDVTATRLAAEEQTAIEQHNLQLEKLARSETLAVAQQQKDLQDAGRQKAISLEEAQNAAEIALEEANLERERTAKLVAIDAKIKLDEQAANAELARQKQIAAAGLAEKEQAAQLALSESAQAKQLQLSAAKTRQEAERLAEEERTAAERKALALKIETEARVAATGAELEGQAAAEAAVLATKTEAEAAALLRQAQAESEAAKAKAAAAKVQADADIQTADATRAKVAAEGLAQAEVEAKRIANRQAEAAAFEAEGLAAANVALEQGKADAEALRLMELATLAAESERASLYETTPALLDLEKMQREFGHQIELAKINAAAQQQMVMYLTQSMDIKMVGGGGHDGIANLVRQAMIIGQGAEVVAEMPMFANIVGSFMQDGTTNVSGPSLSWVMPYLSGILPALKDAIAGSQLEPRMFASLTFEQAVSRFAELANGETSVLDTLKALQADANFRTVANLPVGPILSAFGVPGFSAGSNGTGDDTALLIEGEETNEKTTAVAANA